MGAPATPYLGLADKLIRGRYLQAVNTMRARGFDVTPLDLTQPDFIKGLLLERIEGPRLEGTPRELDQMLRGMVLEIDDQIHESPDTRGCLDRIQVFLEVLRKEADADRVPDPTGISEDEVIICFLLEQMVTEELEKQVATTAA